MTRLLRLDSPQPSVSPHRWKVIDDVLLSFSVPGEIADSTWSDFVSDIVSFRPRHCVMLCIGLISIDANMRRRSTNAMLRSHAMATVLTDHRVTRSLTATTAWFGARIEIYPWVDLPVAIERLHVARGTAQRVLEDARQFYSEQHQHDR